MICPPIIQSDKRLTERQASTYFAVVGETHGAILREAMWLFGEHGYSATTVAQIEAAAGLAPGSGGMYKHFPSKQAVLEAGVRERIEAPDQLPALFASITAAHSLRSALGAIVLAGLERLDSERDLNRILLRDLAQFPDLLALFRDAELARLHSGLTRALQSLGVAAASSTAAVLISAVSHYWVLSDIFGGTHPLGIDRSTFAEAVADLIAATIERGRP